MIKLNNKKGEMKLRDIMFLLLIFSGIIVFTSIFVDDLATNYGNTNMSTSYASIKNTGESNLSATQTQISTWNDGTKKGMGGIALGVLSSTVNIIIDIFLAPYTLSSMIGAILSDIGVPMEVTDLLVGIMSAALYIVIIFTIASAYLAGGKV